MKGLFQIRDEDDGGVSLWFKNGIRVIKVTRYPCAFVEQTNSEDLSSLIQHDAEVFYRGFQKGRG